MAKKKRTTPKTRKSGTTASPTFVLNLPALIDVVETTAEAELLERLATTGKGNPNALSVVISDGSDCDLMAGLIARREKQRRGGQAGETEESAYDRHRRREAARSKPGRDIGPPPPVPSPCTLEPAEIVAAAVPIYAALISAGRVRPGQEHEFMHQAIVNATHLLQLCGKT